MKKIFLLPVFLLLIYSCKKNEVRVVHIDPLVKATFDWHEGSYWVMQDSATGQIDSFYVWYYNDRYSRSSEDKDLEIVNIVFREVNSSNLADSTAWGVTLSAELLNSIEFSPDDFPHSWDSTCGFSGFFPCPIQYSDFHYISNGKQYQNVYFNSTEFVFGTNPLGFHLTAALNYNEGIVYLSSYCSKYRHTWFLLRHNIVR